MATYEVTLYREANDLLKATVRVECNSDNHEEIVAEAIKKAEATDLEWTWYQCGEDGDIRPELTEPSDVYEVQVE